MKPILLPSTVLFLFLLASLAVADPGLLYGKVYTTDNEVFEGFIRWDKNEAAWDDILDGTKDLDRKGKRKRYRDRDRDDDREVSIFGITVYREGRGMWFVDEAESGIRMGHINSLIPTGDQEVLLILKSGEEVELTGGSGDIGDDNREILIDDDEEGVVELYWDGIDKIEFEAGPDREVEFGERLYGTVSTRYGQDYTGFICWDMDEVFSEDILDGREDHRKRKIEFGRIESIERLSSSAAEVTLKNGRKMRLDDSNDIDSGNRGIVISDLKLGAVQLDWDEFDMVVFTNPPKGPRYSDFDGGRPLEGTVYTVDGDKFTGRIRWDDDEEYTWEILDGDYRDIEIEIEFGMIESIEKNSSRSSTVTLRDGRTFKLRDSNDIDRDNKGIFIDDGDDEIVVDWDEFEKIVFAK
jgi:hypothetical protein